MDRYWQETFNLVEQIRHYFDLIFAEDLIIESLNDNINCYPLEYTYALSKDDLINKKILFVFVKSNVYRMNPTVIDLIKEKKNLYFANEVFYVCSNWNVDNLSIYQPELYYPEMDIMLQEFRNKGSMVSNIHTLPEKINKNGINILVVGATKMGNVGDDLTALAIKKCIETVSPESNVYLSDFNINKQDLKNFDLIIIGGGGIIYYSEPVKGQDKCRDHENRRQNLANYLKFGYWAKEFGIPYTVFAVGAQNQVKKFLEDGLDRDFTNNSLDKACCIVIRDTDTRFLFSSNNNIFILPDIVFYYCNKENHALNFNYYGNYLGIIGSFFGHKNLLKNISKDRFSNILKDQFSNTVKYFIMANQDFEIKDKVVNFFRDKGINVKIADLREMSLYQIFKEIEETKCVISLRFHGVILSILAKKPTLIINTFLQYYSDNKLTQLSILHTKHVRLVKDFLPSMYRNIYWEDENFPFFDFLENPDSFRCNDDDLKALLDLTNNYEKLMESILTEVYKKKKY